MTLRLNSTAPDFFAESTEGTIRFHDWIGDSWALLFSHPKHFTPVCTKEFGAVAALKPEFEPTLGVVGRVDRRVRPRTSQTRFKRHDGLIGAVVGVPGQAVGNWRSEPRVVEENVIQRRVQRAELRHVSIAVEIDGFVESGLVRDGQCLS